MYYPELGKNVTVFMNTDQLKEEKDGTIKEPAPAADYHAGFKFTPYKNIIDKINEAGGKAYASMPFLDPFPKDLDAVLSRIKELCDLPGKKFIYGYWTEPDSTMHKYGPDSDAAHKLMLSLEKKLEEFASGLSDTLLFIIADHGQLTCRNHCLLDYPEIMKCLVRLPSIEPRTLNFFVKEEYKAEFPKLFRSTFGNKFLLLSKEEIIESNLFGIGTENKIFRDTLGDYIAIAVAEDAIFVTHAEADAMPGGHAGLTQEELDIPLIVIV